MRLDKFKVSLVSIAVFLSVSACESVPTPIIPDGSSRINVNSDEKIRDYEEQVKEHQRAVSERTAIQAHIEDLQTQIAQLQKRIAEGEEGGKLPKDCPAQVKVPGTISNYKEDIFDKDGKTVFRLSQPFGKYGFIASEAFKIRLLSEANRSVRIEINGRTDSFSDTPGNKHVAYMRALSAKSFLIEHGVDRSLITIGFLGAGDFVNSNRTSNDRAINRRVEIVTSPKAKI